MAMTFAVFFRAAFFVAVMLVLALAIIVFLARSLAVVTVFVIVAVYLVNCHDLLPCDKESEAVLESCHEQNHIRLQKVISMCQVTLAFYRAIAWKLPMEVIIIHRRDKACLVSTGITHC